MCAFDFRDWTASKFEGFQTFRQVLSAVFRVDDFGRGFDSSYIIQIVVDETATGWRRSRILDNRKRPREKDKKWFG
jgi:hypothetical protein